MPLLIFEWTMCKHCGKCIPVCKEKIFYRDYDGLLCAINFYKCTGCRKCIEVCPANALKLETSDN